MIVNGKQVETDNEGFLLNPEDWDRDVAAKLADTIDVKMTEDHWQIIMLVREHYETNHSVPEARILLKDLSERIGKEKATRKYLYRLFPYGYGQQACKIAGMRKPLKLMLDV